MADRPPAANGWAPVFRYRIAGKPPGRSRSAMLMAGFLLAATVATQFLLIMVGRSAYRLAGAIRTSFARQQAVIVILLCLAGLVASMQDVAIHAIRLGWLPLDTGGALVSALQAMLVIAGLALVVPILVLLKQLTTEFARTEAIADNFVDRLPEGVTAETAGLTKRELEIVELVGSGLLSDRELAEALTISPATAATHIRNIMRKTGIRRRADLALMALQPKLDKER